MSVVKSALRYLGLASEPSGGELGLRAPVIGRGGRAASDGALVGAGLSFRGELTGTGSFHILGRFEGEINVDGDVLVGEGAQVDANINASAIVIGGTVRGNLSASSRVEILPAGTLTGTLRTGSFAAADGASVKGEIWVERAQGPHRDGPERGS